MNAAKAADRRLFTPAMLVMVAMSMSAGASIQASAFPGAVAGSLPGAEVRATAQEQTDALIRVVSEAARRFCGTSLDLAVEDHAEFLVHPQPLLWVLHDVPLPASGSSRDLSPLLTSLPPPTLRA